MKKLYKLYYNPKVIGVKNIPSKGPAVLCGNHLNNLDSSIISSTVKRNILWLNNNENEVNKELENNGIVGIFPEKYINIYRLVQLEIMALEKEIIKFNSNKHLRGTDCMTEVARIKNKINEQMAYLDQIKKKLSLMGIKINDYDILLPFNDIAITLAKKYNAFIVPFAITGSISFLSHDLTVRFGEAIKVNGSIETEKNILKENIKKLIYKNY